nr:CU044_5270 family protein [Paenarthrobacter ureafaciens]
MQGHQSATRRRTSRRVILLATAASVLAGALTAAGMLNTIGNTASTAAQAADLLNQAAESSISVSDQPVGRGQYLKVDTAYVGAMHTDGGLTWNTRSGSHLYVPYDRQGEWILDHDPVTPIEYLGSTTKDMVDDYYSSRGLPAVEPAHQIRGLGGLFFTGGNTMSFGHLSPEEETSIPRDPAALIEWIRAYIKGTDSSVWAFIADQLSSGLVPAEWRAVLYKAAALVPGATATSAQTTLDGRAGTAVGRTTDGIRTDIIFDPATGLFIGQRAVNESTGAVTGWSAVRTSVVGSAP